MAVSDKAHLVAGSVRHTEHCLASMQMVKKMNGQVTCPSNVGPRASVCTNVVDTTEINAYCRDTVSCATCRLQINNPNRQQDVGPLSWRGIACKETGTNVRDFAHDKKP